MGTLSLLPALFPNAVLVNRRQKPLDALRFHPDLWVFLWGENHHHPGVDRLFLRDPLVGRNHRDHPRNFPYRRDHWPGLGRLHFRCKRKLPACFLDRGLVLPHFGHPNSFCPAAKIKAKLTPPGKKGSSYVRVPFVRPLTPSVQKLKRQSDGARTQIPVRPNLNPPR